eukprot:m.369502 g.369502  ORF g.369502 m.369502 type:complete len:56 (-) comp16677_c0_seq4:60-227(-)
MSTRGPQSLYETQEPRARVTTFAPQHPKISDSKAMPQSRWVEQMRVPRILGAEKG